jgi:hypothetical protein
VQERQHLVPLKKESPHVRIDEQGRPSSGEGRIEDQAEQGRIACVCMWMHESSFSSNSSDVHAKLEEPKALSRQGSKVPTQPLLSFYNARFFNMQHRGEL